MLEAIIGDALYASCTSYSALPGSLICSHSERILETKHYGTIGYLNSSYVAILKFLLADSCHVRDNLSSFCDNCAAHNIKHGFIGFKDGRMTNICSTHL